MLVVNLAALSKPELQRLLVAARSNAEPTLAAELVTELGRRGDSAHIPPPRSGASGRGAAWLSVALMAALTTVVLVAPRLRDMHGEIPSREPAAPLAAVARSTPQPSSLPIVATLPVATPVSERAAPASAEIRPLASQVDATPRPAVSNPCYAEPTPADRLVCGYPRLGAQHRRLREAYLQALAAGAEAEDLDASQMEWKAARDGVSDLDRLSRLYADRILALEGVTKAALDSAPAA